MEAARLASPDDLGAVVELVRQATAELAEHRGGGVWSRREAWAEPLEACIGTVFARSPERGSSVVGTVDGAVVGYGLMAFEALHDGSTLAVVSDLYVMPEARGVGVGEAMIEMLIAHARSRGAIGIDALALPGDRHTKNFFESAGLTARAIVVHRALAPEVDVDPTEDQR